ncbi:MAG: methyltransferase [Burkholderiales bacterium 35-55-47]|jgi:regulator of RNase E activity RraA|uniref:RraA family protein n=1 Tax=Limnohabitans sp. TaxID=1907725 RepID=UPI000BCED09D|nr:RraA family protein [Limnohabitans sp.]OYY20099.1 MAG: methyltransferase [Burkholderiales bacterium 35-55-47]OYZ74291.1 MAG: methyltransferase [Burkholderiales bacterium 24-55-52]OZB01818.1 MAG: methyltransferase [Burkholderiales bacterium 39-55-53]HQR86330.1 RraA family protein [Limnohabitans sp.]HQS25753.1 RraA family protein [Limnohabitans sp.]
MTYGLRILKRKRAVDLELAKEFLDVPVANVSDCMSRMASGGARLRPMHAGGRMAGPALTVKTRPGDNLMILKALMLAKPGDVIVVDAGGDLTNSLIGEIMVGDAILKKVAGMVINGAIRDSEEIRSMNFPVFAAGVTHRGPYKDGPGEINVPIAIDGMVIEPGDLVIGDGDGLLCVPFDDAQALLNAAHQKQKIEEKMVAEIGDGTYDRSWVDATLTRMNCYIEA